MVGIKDFGSYLPYYRLKRSTIGEAWALKQEMPLLIGERTVAGFDEDCMTMAVEAVFNCLAERATAEIDGLFFASTTPPLADKKYGGAGCGGL
jgi:3-hydroxy-3-methylglutaryl CoA synthase